MFVFVLNYVVSTRNAMFSLIVFSVLAKSAEKKSFGSTTVRIIKINVTSGK